MKKSIYFVLAVILVTLSSLAVSCNINDGASKISLGKVTDFRNTSDQPLAKNQAAPEFQFVMPDGSKVYLSEFRGNIVLLNFWRVDCPYCVEEMPLLQKAKQEWQDKSVVVLGINVGDSQSKAAKFLTGRGLTFPIILDQTPYAAYLYSVSYVPMTFIIDKAGIIKGVQAGAFSTSAEIDGVITSALADSVN